MAYAASSRARCSTWSSGVASASRCLQAKHRPAHHDDHIGRAGGQAWHATTERYQCCLLKPPITATPGNLLVQALLLLNHRRQRVGAGEPPGGDGAGRHAQAVKAAPHRLGPKHHGAHAERLGGAAA